MSNNNKSLLEISYSKVQHGSDLYQGKYSVIKKCLSPYGKPMIYERIPNNSSNDVEKQSKLMLEFSHVNLLRSYKCERSENATIIIYSELVGGGTLKSVIENFGTVSEHIAGGYVGQILRGLQYLHGQAYYLGGFQLTDIIVAAQGVLKIINIYSLPIHNGSFSSDNEKRLADLNSIGRFVEELCSKQGLSDQAKDFVRCCEAQTSAGQLLTHPFCLVDKYLNWEKASSSNMFTQRTGRFGGATGRRGRGRGGTARRGTARRGKAPSFAISARLSGRAPPSLKPSIGIGSSRRGGMSSRNRGGAIISARNRGGMSGRNRGGAVISSARSNLGLAKPPTPNNVNISGRRGGKPIGSGRRGMPIGSGRRGMPIGSGRRGMPIGSGRRGMPNSGRVGFKPPTPQGPPPNSNRISTGRAMLSGRTGFKPPTPKGEPPLSAKIGSSRRGGMSGRRGGFKPPTPKGNPPLSAMSSGRKKGRPPKLSIDTSGEEKIQVVPPASPITVSPKYKDAAAAQAARHRASIGLGVLEKRTPAQLGFLNVLSKGSKVLTPSNKDGGSKLFGKVEEGGIGGDFSLDETMITKTGNDNKNNLGIVPKLNLSKLLKS